jgi:hypothetical protein
MLKTRATQVISRHNRKNDRQHAWLIFCAREVPAGRPRQIGSSFQMKRIEYMNCTDAVGD